MTPREAQHEAEFQAWLTEWRSQLRSGAVARAEARQKERRLRVVRDDAGWREDPHFVGDWTVEPTGGFQL